MEKNTEYTSEIKETKPIENTNTNMSESIQENVISASEDNSIANSNSKIENSQTNMQENISTNNVTNSTNHSYSETNNSTCNNNGNNNYNKMTPIDENKSIKIVLLIVVSLCLLSILGCCCFFGGLVAIPFAIIDETMDSETNKDVFNSDGIGSFDIPNLGIEEDLEDNQDLDVKEEFIPQIEENLKIYDEIENTKTFKEKEDEVEEIVQEIYPSVVSIVTAYTLNSSGSNSLYPQYEDFMLDETFGYASGVIIDQTETELIVVTNAHVVSNNSMKYGYYLLEEEYKSATITFANNKQASAYVKGMDVENDIAVIAIPLANITEDTLKEIKIATIGDSNELNLGETVLAIGNPLGSGLSVTKGIVSSLDVVVSIEDSRYHALQTDAAINPGNSGGGLFNLQGELVAINSSKSAEEGVEGMGYAIPISNIKNIIDELSIKEGDEEDIEYALSTKAGLGIYCFTVDETTAIEYNIPIGVYVSNIKPNYPAYKDGLMINDVIFSINGKEISTADELIAIIETMSFGDNVTLEVFRYNEKDDVWEENTIKTSMGKENK